MFTELKESLKSGYMDLRKSMKADINWKMGDDVDLAQPSYGKLHKPIEFIRNGLGLWFICLLYPGIETSNNLAEQAIEEHVAIRKIIDTFRSESGSQNYQYIFLLLTTWRLQNMSMFVEMDKILREELCQFGRAIHISCLQRYCWDILASILETQLPVERLS